MGSRPSSARAEQAQALCSDYLILLCHKKMPVANLALAVLLFPANRLLVRPKLSRWSADVTKGTALHSVQQVRQAQADEAMTLIFTSVNADPASSASVQLSSTAHLDHE